MEEASLENFDIWLENRYYEVFGQCFIRKDKNMLTTLNSEEYIKLISSLLEDAFRKFSSPNLPLSHMDHLIGLDRWRNRCSNTDPNDSSKLPNMGIHSVYTTSSLH